MKEFFFNWGRPWGRLITCVRLAVGISAAAAPASGDPHERVGGGARVDHGDGADGVDVLVGGERLLPRPSAAPIAAATTVSKERLQEPGQSSADLLRKVTGVQIARSGGASDYATASLRGATAAQTPIYLAGFRLNDDVGGVADLSVTPLWILDRIDVYRGNAPESVDRLGIGGAIVMTPRLPALRQHHELRIGSEIGSFGERGGWTSAGIGGQASAALVGMKWSRGDNDYQVLDDQATAFDTSDDVLARRRNADYESIDFWGVARHALGRSVSVKTVLNVFQREQGVAGFSVTPALRARAKQRRLLAGASVQSACIADEDCQLEAKIQWSSGRSVTLDPLREITAMLTDTLQVRGDRASLRLGLRQWLMPDWQVQASWLAAHETVGLQRAAASSLDATRLSSRLAISSDYHGAKTRLFALLAADCQGTSARDVEEAGDLQFVERPFCEEPEVIARVGAEYPLNSRLKLLVTGGRTVRVPTLGEIFGTSPAVRGNEELRTEKSIGMEVGLKGEHSGTNYLLEGEAFAYFRDTDDLIGFRLASLGIVRPFNIGRARHLGLESALVLQLFDVVRLNGSLTLLEPRDTTPDRTLTNNQLPFRSRSVIAAGAEVAAALPALRADRLTFGVDYFRRAARFADNAGLVVIPTETAVDLRLSAAFFRERLWLRATVRNTFDERYLDSLGAPLPGRSVHAALEGVLDG